jgi:hypothetical protein
MIDTTTTIERMPRLLASFKKYIEKYVCSYEVSNKGEHPVYSLVFYEKKSEMGYIIVCVDETSKWPIIYVNKNADNVAKANCIIRPENYISNDMNAFITEIRKCIETNPQKAVSEEVGEVMKAFPEGVKVI